MGDFSFLINSVQNITGPMVVMWLIGGLLIWLAIKKDYERPCCSLWASAPSW